MKKKFGKTLAYILVFGMIFGAALSACKEVPPGSHEEIEPREATGPVENLATLDADEGEDKEVELRIKQDFLLYMHSQGEVNMTLEMVKVLENYGNYNDAVVVRMNRGAFAAITTIQVGGIDFIFSNSNTALVWHSGQFFELAEAYDNGLLSKENLTTIAEKVNN